VFGGTPAVFGGGNQRLHSASVPNGVLTLPARWISFEHCFIAKCVLIGSSKIAKTTLARDVSQYVENLSQKGLLEWI
jgi:hypothetical protein